MFLVALGLEEKVILEIFKAILTVRIKKAFSLFKCKWIWYMTPRIHSEYDEKTLFITLKN